MARPIIPIDWTKVDELLLAGCSGIEIAANFHIHHDTFYEKVKEHYNVSFTEYATSMWKRGDSMIRQVQFSKAMDGDNKMLTLLGKNRLGQIEGDRRDVETPNDSAIKELLDALKSKASP